METPGRRQEMSKVDAPCGVGSLSEKVVSLCVNIKVDDILEKEGSLRFYDINKITVLIVIIGVNMLYVAVGWNSDLSRLLSCFHLMTDEVVSSRPPWPGPQEEAGIGDRLMDIIAAAKYIATWTFSYLDLSEGAETILKLLPKQKYLSRECNTLPPAVTLTAALLVASSCHNCHPTQVAVLVIPSLITTAGAHSLTVFHLHHGQELVQ